MGQAWARRVIVAAVAARIEARAWARRLIVAALVLLACVPAAGSASAQTDKVYQFKRLDVNITVQPNGDLSPDETQEYQYGSGTFTFGFRAIPTARLDDIGDVHVTEGTQTYRETDVDDTPNSFRTYTNSDNDFEIRWFYPTLAIRARVRHRIHGEGRPAPL